MSLLDHVQIRLVDSVDEAWALKEWMGQAGRTKLAIDTETEGLNWWEHKVRLVQVSDADTAWVIPWEQWGGVAQEICRAWQGEWVAHNLKFDWEMLKHWCGIELPRHKCHDTRVSSHILDPTKPTGLKPIASRLIDQRAVASQAVLDDAMSANKWTWATVPIDYSWYWVYAGLDTVLTYRLDDIQRPLVMADAPAAYDLEMEVTWAMAQMELRGMALDVEFTREKKAAFDRFVDECTAWVMSEYGLKAGADQAIIERLQRDIPADVFTFVKMTPSGAQLSLDKEVLQGCIAATGHPLAKVTLERRQVQRLSSAYLRNFLELEHEGRVHTSFNAFKEEDDGYGARTGRMSVSQPSLQNLPRKSNSRPSAIAVRNCLTASADSMLVLTDYDQVEMRMLASLSEDPALVAAFLEPGDFFTNMARTLYADPSLQKSDPRRSTTKNAAYSKIYGAQAAKFSQTAGVSPEQGEAVYRALSVQFPGMDSFMQQVQDLGGRRYREEGVAYVRSPLTHRRHVAGPRKLYTLVNYLIQGTCAEIMKKAAVDLMKTEFGQYLTLAVHDELILDVPDDQVDDAVQEMQVVMTDRTSWSVPITAGSDVSFRWGDK